MSQKIPDVLVDPLRIVLVWVLVAVMAIVLRRLLRVTLRRALTAATSSQSDSRRASRAESFIAVLTSAVSLLAIVLGITMSLGVLGISAAPLLASLGFVGVAVGFGAQKVVQDFLAGILMLAEDHFGVGDIIDVGEASGVVEALSLRSVRLRSLDGTVWHVPNGEIRRVGNMSQNWSRAVIDVGVSYGEDMERVFTTVSACIEDFELDPEWASKLTDRCELLGIERFGESAVDIRILLPTQPGAQWSVARGFRRRLKEAFDRSSIEFPFPQVTISGRLEGLQRSG